MANNNEPEMSEMDHPEMSERVEVSVNSGGEAGFTEGEVLAGGTQDEPLTADDLQRLVNDLDSLVAKLRLMTPGYSPPPYSAQRLRTFISENLDGLTADFDAGILESVRKSINEDLLDPDTWRGLWYMLNYYAEYQGDFLKRRLRGEYETDDWGLDQEFVDVVRPLFDFLYRKYFRVETSGIENIPETGRALLVSNHSGQIPWDGSMIASAVLNDHPSGRLIRALFASWFTQMPVLSAVLVKLGQTLANEENGIRLLEQGEIVLVFPEGIKGISKLYKDRYKLARFGRGGFVRMALKTSTPIIPVSVVGAEETYITFRQTRFISKLIGYPFLPISLRWPWLGLLGLVPLPTKWYIDFGAPIQLDRYGDGADEDIVLVSQLTNQVRNTIQNMIYQRLGERKSIFFG